ncbi:RagB/SusD family nutrient uptake outer membrane protein [Flavobacterium sp. U410]
MKLIKNKIIKTLVIATLITSAVSCSDDFLDRAPQDTYSVDDFHYTNEQVISRITPLYFKPWFNFHNKAFFAITEVGSGNMFTYSSDVNSMVQFSITSSDPELLNAWKGLFAVVAQSNDLINNLRGKVGPAVDAEVVDNVIGEAYFLRANAYFYLVRLWENVPIIEDNQNIESIQIPTNPREDIYKFIEMDLEKAIELLPEKVRGIDYVSNMRVSKGSAKSILAKVYLAESKYVEAQQMAGDVIGSGEFKLLGGTELPNMSFGDLFLTANNNNQESIFALQWVSSANYGSGSNCNTQFGYSSYINEASYGGVFGPSQDILGAYSSSDLRRKETFMLPGDYYPNLITEDGGPLTVPSDINAQSSGSGIKKYVVGKSTDASGPSDQWGMMTNNTYIMRYADLLLIYAEATLAGGSSTTNASALDAINAVRARAGLSALTVMTRQDVLTERRLELAFEGDYWFDLLRMPRAEAINILSNQNRGDQYNAQYYTPTEDDFAMPYPATEIVKNPLLQEDPVPYDFGG